MHKTQFDQLRREFHAKDHRRVSSSATVYLYIKTGQQKGRLGRVEHIGSTDISVRTEEGLSVSYPYIKFERVDADGTPLIVNAVDITGRPITGTPVVCYSICAGAQSHALEIGRVIKINPSGTLAVQPIIRNGVRLVTYNGNAYRARSMVRAARVIVLPIDAALVTTWVLSNFEVYEADALLR